MKVALIFGGQGRFVTSAFDSIKKKIIDVYNPDIYCHLWWDENIKNHGYLGARDVNYLVDSNTPTIIQNQYSPKKFIIEPPVDVWNHPKLKDISCPDKNNYLSQLYSIQQVSNLFDWSEYDFIIKWRYDMEVSDFLNLNHIDRTKFHTYCHVLNREGGVDHFLENFFDDTGYILPNDMRQFLQVIDNINEFKLFNGSCIPENTLVKTLELLNFHNKLQRYHTQEFNGRVLRT